LKAFERPYAKQPAAENAHIATMQIIGRLKWPKKSTGLMQRALIETAMGKIQGHQSPPFARSFIPRAQPDISCDRRTAILKRNASLRIPRITRSFRGNRREQQISGESKTANSAHLADPRTNKFMEAGF